MLHFVQEHQFCRELEWIEPSHSRQVSLLERIERACFQRISRDRAIGTGFVIVAWERRLITWYETDGAVVYLQSIRFDLRRA
jgi:hypothetical protein